MAKIAVDVLLVDGTNEETFISSFDDIPEVELKNRLPNSPTLLVLNVEESYISTLESDSRVVSVDIVLPCFLPIAPIHDSEEYAEQNKIIAKEIESLPKEPEGSDVKKEYNVTCSNKSDWDFIREELEKDGSIEDNIPTPNCHCFNECLQSDVRGGFLLTDNEADELRKNPKVISVHIETGAYPGTYPRFYSDFVESKEYRYASTVKHQRDWDSSGVTPTSPNKSLENRCSSHLKRHMQKACPWQGGTGSDGQVFDDRIQQHGTGKDVDVIVCDSNVWFGHIEFQNDYDTNNNNESMTTPSNYIGGNVLPGNGTCDVLDLVLDAPYYIDPAWFNADASNRLTVRWDGTIVPVESAAKAWWSNSSNRSSQFINSGTVSSSTLSSYTRLKCNGSNVSRNTESGTHGTPCMSQTYGRQYGWAYNANKWFLSNLSGSSPSFEACFDLQKIFHQTKPNRPSDNTKNPTVSSNSWGFRTSPPSSGWYYFRPSAIDGSVTGVQFSGGTSGSRPAFLNHFTGDRANRRSPEFEETGATLTAGKELVDAGVIFVCAAGNNSQKSVKSNHPDYNNYFASSSSTSYENSKKSSVYGSYVNSAKEYGSTSRRGFPAQIGCDRTTTPYTYKTINIGCLDDVFTSGKERNVDYTNKGEGVDGWTQGDESLAAQSQSWGGYNRYDRTFTIAHGNNSSDSAQRDTSNTSNTTSLTSRDRMFNGTSSACPIAAGIIATVLETNRNWTFEDVRDWMKDDCGQVDTNNFYMGTEATTADSSDWADNNSAGGYAPTILWDVQPSAGGGGGGGGGTEPRVIPDYYSLSNKTLKTSSITGDGTNYISLQHYLDSDIIRGEANKTIGGHNSADDYQNFSGVTYKSRWTGKYVDIVTMEATTVSSFAGYQDTHPDFDNPDNTGNTRCVPMNWSGCEGASNNQVSNNSMFSAHGIGVLSAAGGIYGGLAKRASLRACYCGDGDDQVECFDAIKAWHNAKGNNSETGVKNPTIVIGEYQWLADNYYSIKVEDVNSVTDPTSGTTSKPGGGWGSNLTPFTSRNIYPYRVKDPDDNSWHWMVTLPYQTQHTSLKTAMDQAWDAGIILINAAGNNGGVYVKENDARWNGTYIDITSGTTKYDIRYSDSEGSTVTKGTTSTTRWYPLRAYGPHGHVKSIDVAAGQNSETHPILDGYSNRGPGIDITGLGAETYTSYPTVTDSNGHKWGFFSGTSCAAPTVVGKAACILEKYYTYHGSFPTPDQLKQMLLAQSKDVLASVDSTTWNNVPTASDNDIVISESMSSSSVLKIKTGISANGSFRMAELAGTPNKRAYWNAKGYKRRSTKGRRPFSGKVYPRRNNRIEKRS